MNDQEMLKLIDLIDNNLLDAKHTTDLYKVLQQTRKEKAFANYEIYAREYIKIINKDGVQVPLIHNDIQKKINATINALHATGKLVRILILKARQEGVSTVIQGRMLCKTATKENRNGLIVAQEAKPTSVIFEKAKYMYDNLPAHVKPLKRLSNAQELVFDRPFEYKGKEKGLHSKISIQVAGSTSIGRGDTIHYVHASEFAYWPSPEGKSPIKQLNGILEAVPLTPDTEVIIEGTANGVNDFKTLWDAAVNGESEWTPLFFAWFDDKTYQMECTDEDYERKINSLDLKMQTYLAHIRKTYKLSKEQIYWYIWKLQNNCNSDHNMMKQENPTFPEEAFLATGTPVFNNEKINERIAYLRRAYKTKPPIVGRFTFEWGDRNTQDYIQDKTIKWVNDPHGFITIYELPRVGVPYVNGGDTKGESINSDKYAATVINNTTGNRCAVIHGQWTNSNPYTWQMYCLGMYYNIALIGIEVNFNTAPIEELQRLHYPRQYIRRKYDDYTKEYKTSYGWKTDGNTRRFIIDKEISIIEEHIELFNDISMLLECVTFVFIDGRPDAQSGKHDDVLMSDMIANEIRPQQSREVEIKREPERGLSFDEDPGYGAHEEESPFN